jgi:glyoxylase-like metal-dependent hydrolase (beta-lactamase superfamily II)
MTRRSIVVLALALAGCAAKSPPAHVIPGSVPLDWRGPDGNSVILQGLDGLIVVDTGRHPAHAQAILDYARERKRPIAAIVNTHWHLDHTTGNADIRQAYPRAQVYATTAIEGALKSFLGRNREQSDKTLGDPKVPAEQKAQILRGRSRIDHPDTLRPTRPVTHSGHMQIAGRQLDVHVAPLAATEADLWLYDPKTREAVVGDLVVDIVPFMDTACADGWLSALREIERTPFTTLIPGHGPVMDRSAFVAWKTAFDHFVECGRSAVDKAKCVAGWEHDAARFIDKPHRQYVREAADYYLTTRFRSSPDEQQRYCKSL